MVRNSCHASFLAYRVDSNAFYLSISDKSFVNFDSVIMVRDSHKRLLFGICECRRHIPYRGRSLKKHIQDTKHSIITEFLFCPDHLLMLHKTATNEDKQQFYDAHNKCSNTKVSSPKVKEFFAAQETLRYIEQHTSRQQAHEIGSLIDTDTSSDDEQITPDHTTNRFLNCKYLILMQCF